ncbi:hypothetical protein LIER_20562 [Lithospermum erythrorhizon]|uniref:Uncharacterized protein n=1 Tax=Lithospermum erythrorhizon TaxID=34254 RepID=A0AAV3QPW6_LITER
MHFNRGRSQSLDGLPNITGRVNVILGGRRGGGDYGSARRAYAKRDIYSITAGARHELRDLSFSRKDFEGIEYPHEDLLMITPVIANFEVGQMLVDTGSSIDILFLDAYLKLRMSRAQIRPVATPLVWVHMQNIGPFRSSKPYGDHVEASAASHKDSGVYHHGYIKFPTRYGIGEIQDSQKKGRGCYLASEKCIKAQMKARSSSRIGEGVRIGMCAPYPGAE